MPELPEVENVKLSLESQGALHQRFTQVDLLRKNLRTPLKSVLKTKLPGQTILTLRRRAKFLLFETEDFILLSHLGMTGSWRVAASSEIYGKHDHIVLHFESGLQLIYNDPRRFGILELLTKKDLGTNKWLRSLGVEPLSEEFTADMLFKLSRKRKSPIKGFLMDQKIVVGVGNIYASEALYQARIKPSRLTGRVSRLDMERLVQAVREVLNRAIRAGGSTISDYRNSKGEAGNFQSEFSVYDRAKSPCKSCGSPIRSRVIAGRNTFWCAKCQR